MKIENKKWEIEKKWMNKRLNEWMDKKRGQKVKRVRMHLILKCGEFKEQREKSWPLNIENGLSIAF